MDNAITNQTPEKKLTILLVEDDPLLIKMYTTKFEMDGYMVISAEDGESGLKLALENDVDFIILDMMLPRVSGLDILTKLKQDPLKKDIPVIMLSNLASQKDAEKAVSLGAKEYFVKANFTPTEIAQKVKQYLGK